MNRITSTTRRRLTPRAAIIGGAALGLIAGATLYGAVSSSATSMTPAAFKAPVAKTAALANCAAGTTLTKGVCVVHLTRAVTVPPSADSAAAKAKAAHLSGATPGHLLKPAGKRDKDKDKDGDRRGGSESGRDRAGHENAGDADGAAAKPAVKTPAPVAVKAPVPSPAPVVAGAPAPVPVASAAS